MLIVDNVFPELCNLWRLKLHCHARRENSGTKYKSKQLFVLDSDIAHDSERNNYTAIILRGLKYSWLSEKTTAMTILSNTCGVLLRNYHS